MSNKRQKIATAVHRHIFTGTHITVFYQILDNYTHSTYKIYVYDVYVWYILVCKVCELQAALAKWQMVSKTVRKCALWLLAAGLSIF